jgi:hypothetical protein
MGNCYIKTLLTAAGIFLGLAHSTEVLTHFVLPYGANQSVTGSYQLPYEKSAINNNVAEALQPCLQSQYFPSLRESCQDIFQEYGLMFMSSRAMGHRMVGYIYTDYLYDFNYSVHNIQANIEPNTNILNYTINYSVTSRGCMDYSPSSNCGAMHMTILWNNTEEPLNFDYSFWPGDRKLAIYMDSIEWADIHLTINNGPLLNYRLQKSGDNLLTQQLPTYIKNGDVVRFHMTYKKISQAPQSSERAAVNIKNLTEYFRETLYGYGYVYAQIAEDAENVIIHYSVNGKAYENVYMDSWDQRTFTYHMQNVQAGDVITYFFTYFVNGLATDTQVKNYTVQNW